MSKDELFQGPPVELSVYKKVQESQISSIIDDIKEELHNILSVFLEDSKTCEKDEPEWAIKHYWALNFIEIRKGSKEESFYRKNLEQMIGRPYEHESGILIEYLNMLWLLDRVEKWGPCNMVTELCNPLSYRQSTYGRFLYDDDFKKHLYGSGSYETIEAEKLGYCLFLYFDRLLSRKECFRYFSKEFKNMLDSDLRYREKKPESTFSSDSDNEALSSPDTVGSGILKNEYEADNRARNLKLLRKEVGTRNQSGRNLVNMFFNATKNLAGWEEEYIEWRLRIDTAWRLYFVFFTCLPMKNLHEKGYLDEQVEEIVRIVSSIQDNSIRKLFINDLYRIMQQRLADKTQQREEVLKQIKEECSLFASFVKKWTNARREIVSEKKYDKLIVGLLAEFIKQYPPITGIMTADEYAYFYSAVTHNSFCIRPLQKVLSKLLKEDRLPDDNNKLSEEEVKQLTPEESSIYQVLSKSRTAPAPLLFKAIWTICFEEVPDIKVQKD